MVNSEPLRVGIVGFGVIGKGTASVFEDVLVHDPPMGLLSLDRMRDTDVVFVCVPTPTRGRDQNLDILVATIGALSRRLADDHLVFVRSTVLPGTTKRLQTQYPSLNLVHNPEFLRSHRIEEDSRNPSRIVLGTDANRAELRNRIESIYIRSSVENASERIAIVDTVAAELIKYLANCFLAMKVGFFNEVHEICDRLSCDSYRVRELIGKDERIGCGIESEVVPGRPGLWDECLPKDLAAFRGFLASNGLPGTLIDATGHVDDRVKRRVLSAMAEHFELGRSVPCVE